MSILNALNPIPEIQKNVNGIKNYVSSLFGGTSQAQAAAPTSQPSQIPQFVAPRPKSQMSASSAVSSPNAPKKTVAPTAPSSPAPNSLPNPTSNPNYNYFQPAPTTQSQSSAIQSGANSGSLTSQLYSGKTGTTPTTPPANDPSMTTMYKADGTSVQVPTANQKINSYDANSNPNGFYAKNPNSNTGSNAQTTPNGTTPTGAPPSYADLINKAQGVQSQLEQSKQNQATSDSQIGGLGIPDFDKQGQQRVNDTAFLSQQNALGSEYQADVDLAGKAAPVLQFGQLTNPFTGEPIGGQGGNNSLNSAVGGIAQKVKNGAMSYDDAVNSLQGYGQAGVNALQTALGPNFNVNQSNAQATAQTKNTEIAGQTGALVDKTNQGLDTLSSAFDQLGALQKTGSNWLSVPINALSEGTGVGKTQLDNYNRILAEVRASAQSVLSTAANLGVVTGGATANSLLPDNMSRQGLTTAISTIKALEEQTKSALGKISNATPSNSNTGGGGNTPMFGSFNG